MLSFLSSKMLSSHNYKRLRFSISNLGSCFVLGFFKYFFYRSFLDWLLALLTSQNHPVLFPTCIFDYLYFLFPFNELPGKMCGDNVIQPTAELLSTSISEPFHFDLYLEMASKQ